MVEVDNNGNYSRLEDVEVGESLIVFDADKEGKCERRIFTSSEVVNKLIRVQSLSSTIYREVQSIRG